VKDHDSVKAGPRHDLVRTVVRVTTDSLDVSLHDAELRDEVDLTGRLIVAANQSDGMLSRRDIDEALGVSTHR
jgi:hypothetical protein